MRRFWGVEVKAGKPRTVQPNFGRRIHISQASLGEVKKDASKGAKNVPLRLKIDGKDFIIGNLAPENRPELMFDLVFEREFELSHDLKTGSVYFLGYTSQELIISDVKPAFSGSSLPYVNLSNDEEVESKENVEAKTKPVEKAAAAVAVPNGAAKATKAAPAAKAVVAKKQETSDSDDDEDDTDEKMPIAESLAGDSSDDLSGQDDDDSEEEEEPVKASNKRPAQPVASSPGKKAKASTPTDNKTGSNKKGLNPSKPAGKASPGGNNSNNNKSKQSPKFGGQFSGGNKNFNSKNGGKGKRGGK